MERTMESAAASSLMTHDDFKKLDIRIGTVLAAEKLPDTDKLLKLLFDVGGEQRQIIAGIAASFPDPSVLVGKQLPVLMNIEPRELRGHTSQGMLLAVAVDGQPVLLHPERDVPPGSVVR